MSMDSLTLVQWKKRDEKAMVTAEEVNKCVDRRWKIDVETKVQSQGSSVDDVVTAFRNSTNVWMKGGRWFDELNARGEVISVEYVAAFSSSTNLWMKGGRWMMR